MGQTKTPSDQPTSAKKPTNFLWSRRSDDVEVLWGSAQEKVSDTPTHQIGMKAKVVKAPKHSRCISIDQAMFEAMLRKSDGVCIHETRPYLTII